MVDVAITIGEPFSMRVGPDYVEVNTVLGVADSFSDPIVSSKGITSGMDVKVQMVICKIEDN